MKKIVPTLIVCFFTTVLFFACTIKKRVYQNGYYIDWKVKRSTTPQFNEKQFVGFSMNAYNSLGTKASCENVIDVSEPNEILCAEGTVIQIPEDAFVYESGKPIKCSLVTVIVKEFYKMSDIVEAGLTTTCNKAILASGGMIYIEANCYTDKLKLKSGKSIIVKMPCATADRRMKCFSGRMENGIIDWKLEGKVRVSGEVLAINNPVSVSDTTPMVDYEEVSNVERSYEGEGGESGSYLMEVTKLGWINCDRFYELKEPAKLIVKADSLSKSFVAIVFKNMKSVLPGYCYTDNTTIFNNIPAGEDVTILAYRVNEKTKMAQLAKQDFVIGDTNAVQLTMEPMSIDDLKDVLKSLN